MNPPFTPIIPVMPNFIQNLDTRTIPFETRFVRNQIDSDITLPTAFTSLFDETTTLNGRTLTISGLQFGDSINFAPGSGFTAGFPNVSLNGSPIASLSGNQFSLTMTFTTSFSPAQLEQLLEALTFQAGPTTAPTSSRTLTYTVNTANPLIGNVGLILAAPLETNQIRDLDNQTVPLSATSVRLDGAITLSDAFIDAYSSPGSLGTTRIAITGWTGPSAQITFVSGSGIALEFISTNFAWVDIDGVRVGSYNPFGGTIDLNPSATISTIERLIEAIEINPQLTSQSPNRTITVTIITPTLPQTGTVTFTGVPLTFSDLRESVDVDLAVVSATGLLLDSSVTIAGGTSWEGGTINVSGLLEGDRINFQPDIVDPVPGAIIFQPATNEILVIDFLGFYTIGTVTTSEGGVDFILNSDSTLNDVEKIIEGLRLFSTSAGNRTLSITVQDGSGFTVTDTIRVNVEYVPTVTDIVAARDLTAAEAAAGQILDADVSIRADGAFGSGGMSINGLLPGDEISLRTGPDTPFTTEPTNGALAIYFSNGGNPNLVATLTTEADGIRFSFADVVGPAIIEALIENLVFRTTGATPAATRDISIRIVDTNGAIDTQVVTVNVLPAGAKELTYEILQDVNGSLLPVTNGAGTTGDLNPSDLFGKTIPPDSFVVEYSGLLQVGQPDFGQRTIISFTDVAPGTVLVVDGVAYPLAGPEGRLALDLAPGLHKISFQLPYDAPGGQLSTTPPTLTIGTASPPSDGEEWPDYDQTPLFDHVRTVPETLYRLDVVSTLTRTLSGEVTEFSSTVYLTVNSPGAIREALQAILQALSPPPGYTVGQTFTTVVEQTGGTGSEVMAGLASAEAMFGGAGNDTLLGSLGADTLDGGTGDNTVSYEASNGRVTVDLSTGVGRGGHAEGDVLRNIQNVIGSRSHDTVTGSSGANNLFGGRGRDTLSGGGGNDLLNGGGEDDVLYGGTDNDTLLGGNGNDILSGDEGDDLLLGDHGDDSLSGGAGNDALRGGVGADTLDGGEGNNRAQYGTSTTGVSVSLTTGTGSAGDALGDVLRNISALRGSAHADTLVGSRGDDTLDGGAGDDVLSGMTGNDRLIGGAGADTLYGGDGNDLFNAGEGADVFYGGAGNDQVSYGSSALGVTIDLAGGSASGGDAEGDTLDSINTVSGSALADSISGSALADTLTGRAGNDTLIGQDGNDMLVGGEGADSLLGGAGNDVLLGGEGADALDGGEGVNTLSYRGSNAGVMVNLAAEQAYGGHASGDVIENFQNVIGSDHQDYLIGSSANETLSGGLGADTLIGGGGSDLLSGGDGADTFQFLQGSGSDRIRDMSDQDQIGIDVELWGEIPFADPEALIQAFGHQVGSYVELRFSETDILRIDNITLAGLSQFSIVLLD